MKEYLEQHKIMHSKNNVFVGNSLLKYSKYIKEIISDTKPERLLDYGCGKGLQYTISLAHKDWGMENCPVLYDPCYEPFSYKPEGKFDMVICTDVLEHVPREELGEVVRDIFRFTDGLAFFGVSVRPAKKNLPNGNNAHSTIKPISWWKAKIDKHNINDVKYDLCYEDPDTPEIIKKF